MAFRFPHLLITATFGALSAELSLRAEAAPLEIGELDAGIPAPQAGQETVQETAQELAQETAREASMRVAITFRRDRNTPRADSHQDR
jgi:hypothetical protein